MIRIILIRHGQTAWNAAEGQGERFRGLTNLPLASEGVVQARVTAHHLAQWPLSAVYSSPLERAVRTAEIIAQPHHIVAHNLPGLKSIDYGDWAGQLYADVARHSPDLYRLWRHDPFSVQIPGGENMADFRERAVASIHTVLQHHQDGERLAFVTHQAVTKVLACALAGLPNTAYWQLRQDICNLTQFDYDLESKVFNLVGLNDTCHLTPQIARAGEEGTRIILVRHGQTGWNAGAGNERFRGRTDLPLDETGEAQAEALAEWLMGEPVAALYTSPLLRARQTLQPIADALGLPLQNHDGLLDVNYGRFQGLTRRDAASAYPEVYGRWLSTPSQAQFPDGESLGEVQARVQALLQELVARHRHETVVLAGHEIVNKVIACALLGLDLDQIWRVRQDPAGIDVFQYDGASWLTLCVNDTCHLQDVTGPV